MGECARTRREETEGTVDTLLMKLFHYNCPLANGDDDRTAHEPRHCYGACCCLVAMRSKWEHTTLTVHSHPLPINYANKKPFSF